MSLVFRYRMILRSTALSMQRASSIFIHHSTPGWRTLPSSVDYGATCVRSSIKAPMRHPLNDWRVITLNSRFATFGQLPCFAV